MDSSENYQKHGEAKNKHMVQAGSSLPAKKIQASANKRKKKKTGIFKRLAYNTIKKIDSRNSSVSKIYKRRNSKKSDTEQKQLPAVIRLKNKFKKNGLNTAEAHFNAYFIYFLKKSEKKGGEYGKSHQKNIYDAYISLLALAAKIFGLLCYSGVKTRKFIFSTQTLVAAVSLSSVVFVTAMIVHIYSFTPNFQIYIDGESIGIVENIKNLDVSIALAEKNISSVIGRSYKLSADINYKIVLTKNPVYLSDRDLYNALYNLSQESITEAYGLYMDGKLVGTVFNEEDIDSVLREVLYEQNRILKDSAILSDTENESEVINELQDGESDQGHFEFLNEIRVKQSKYLKNTVVTADELKTALLLAIGKYSHEALAIDNALAEAHLTNTIPRETQNFLFTANTFFAPVSGSIGTGSSYYFVVDEFGADLGISDLEIQFKHIKTETATVEVPFVIEYRESENHFVNTKIIEVNGVNGEDEVTAKVTYFEDIEIARNITSINIIKEAVNQVVVIGIKELPSTVPTGRFIFPVVYRRMTDMFGDDGHRGIDFVAGYGTPVIASDGGTVIIAGESESYGNYIVLRHSKGADTLYAHLSEILIKQGEKVFQGQHIGKVGSTGNSTGAHLHFEIHINGGPVDPLKHLNK